ncbi:hypothetical protein [Actinomadura macrotermitis]|uniref:hypothetical protein n=1 Tax=Actinomadura macrotermitis TaxID=2585200 RepID=UPI0012953926|nr:hypothetical protein [Actinomadura macrotermitis]
MVAVIKGYEAFIYYRHADDRARKEAAASVERFKTSLLAAGAHLPSQGQVRLTANRTKGISIQSIKSTDHAIILTVRSMVRYRDTILPGDAVMSRCFRLDMAEKPGLNIVTTEISCSAPPA